METIENIIALVEKLAGQRTPFPHNKVKLQSHDPFKHGGIGYSELNELLLTLGYDRITSDFFRYLFNDVLPVKSYTEFAEGIEKFRKHAMLLYGNIKFAFKTLSGFGKNDPNKTLKRLQPIPTEQYKNRPDPLHKIKHIPPEEAYYLGYIVENEIREKLKSDPTNPALLEAQARLKEVRNIGRENHDAYLTYDYMDVYIATSMREPFEFYMVQGFTKELFSQQEIEPLKLRWFDPTQCYCEDRIDKGLVEGLMVKRSKCTIYHVQEADTLGKDSELAATLAQGKPVIAYVPRLVDPETFKSDALQLAQKLYPNTPIEYIIRELLPRYYPEGVWKDTTVRDWLARSRPIDVDQAFDLLFQKARDLYENRAKTLRESHPLALQVNLDTGVANGVLVVRTVADCAKLLQRIILNTMEFDIEEQRIGEKVTMLLRERVSRSIFRVVTGDELLTNSFWNFYLEESSNQFD